METQMIIREDKATRINQGFHFFNFEKKEEELNEGYYIEVSLETDLDLMSRKESLRVVSNIFRDFERHYDFKDFIKEFKGWAKKPIVEIREFNRKAVISFWDSKGLDKYKTELIEPNQVRIEVGDLADKHLKEKCKMDFKKYVTELLSQQMRVSEEVQKLVDRFIYLKEKKVKLEELGANQESFIKSVGEYNGEMKKIETELKDIAKKLGVEVEKYDFKYKPISKKVSYKEWLKANRDELEEAWEQGIVEDYDDFDDFCKEMYEQSEGEIEVAWEN